MEMKKIKITHFPEPQSLSEVYQAMDLKYSFLRKVGDLEYAECNPLAKCRDYLHDVVDANLRKGEFEIYGMVYHADKHPIDLDVIRFGLKFPNKKALSCFKENIQFLRGVEAKHGLTETSCTEVVAVGNYVIVEGDKFWLTNTVILNLYTYLLRCLCYEVSEGKTVITTPLMGGKESEYRALIGEERLQELCDRLPDLITPEFHGWPNDIQTSYLHNFSGIVSFFGGKGSGYGDETRKSNAHYKLYVERGLAA